MNFHEGLLCKQMFGKEKWWPVSLWSFKALAGGGSLGGNVPFSWEPSWKRHSFRVKRPHSLTDYEISGQGFVKMTSYRVRLSFQHITNCIKHPKTFSPPSPLPLLPYYPVTGLNTHIHTPDIKKKQPKHTHETWCSCVDPGMSRLFD